MIDALCVNGYVLEILLNNCCSNDPLDEIRDLIINPYPANVENMVNS